METDKTIYKVGKKNPNKVFFLMSLFTKFVKNEQ